MMPISSSDTLVDRIGIIARDYDAPLNKGFAAH
jgi:hypothetical protein